MNIFMSFYFTFLFIFHCLSIPAQELLGDAVFFLSVFYANEKCRKLNPPLSSGVAWCG